MPTSQHISSSHHLSRVPPAVADILYHTVMWVYLDEIELSDEEYNIMRNFGPLLAPIGGSR